MTITVASASQALFEQTQRYLSAADQARVRAALKDAINIHDGQLRKSGEPYITHPITVASYLAEYDLDAPALIAALLHDAVEDVAWVDNAQIADTYGNDVARIVEGVTKLEQSADNLKRRNLSTEQRNRETVRKVFRYVTKDVRVALIKLFDRLHNMRTMGAMPQHKQEKKARETLTVYTPLANRLGMWTIKNELEARSYRILYKERFERVEQESAEKRRAMHKTANLLCRDLRLQLSRAGLNFLDVSPLYRQPSSIFRECCLDDGNGVPVFDDIPRIVVQMPDRLSCYQVLGMVHGLWQPQPNAFDDYIARPKENLYRALHTTVMHHSKQKVKIRIRSEAMFLASDMGVLAQWKYAPDLSDSAEVQAIQEDVTFQVNTFLRTVGRNLDVEDGLNSALGETLGDQIRVHTPAGETKELPVSATPLDFAYNIHTALGNACKMAYVNGQVVALNEPLADGDQIQIRKHSTIDYPRRYWLVEELGYLRTTKAKSAARRYFKRLPEHEAVQQGRMMLRSELHMLDLEYINHSNVAELMDKPSVDALYLAIGHAELLTTEVATAILQQQWADGLMLRVGHTVQLNGVGASHTIHGARDFGGIHLCRQCKPTPQHTIYGFVRADNHLTVHCRECSHLQGDIEPERIVRLRWGLSEDAEVRRVVVKIEVYDRADLLFDVLQLLRPEHINIAWIETPRKDNRIQVLLCLEVHNPHQLVTIAHRIRALPNVQSIHCVFDSKDV